MGNQISRIFSWCLLSLIIVAMLTDNSVRKVYAEQPQGWNSAACSKFDYWIETALIPADNLKSVNIGETFFVNEEIYPFIKPNHIYGLSISGSIQLNNDLSLVRVILVGDDFHEYLVYEAYPLIIDNTTFSITMVCEETCVLDSVIPHSLKIDLIDASIHIEELCFLDSPPALDRDTGLLQKQIKETQNAAKIRKINDQIKKKGLKWIAGETSVSQLFYEEKRKLFGGVKVPNLQGAEYYKGGIFEIKSKSISPSLPTNDESSLIEFFDWRNRHGANNPDSPYYDGDPTGSGWITPVKSQGCNHCWAFSPLHATEAIVNLYFNQHLDLDLSEQDVASCSGGNIGCCEGGYIGTALNYIINTGVVDEGCFPYSASCESCASKCSDPSEQISISGKLYPGYDEEDIKRAIIDYGPITGGISSWWHFMVMVGFDRDPDDGKTIWIFKNSWGTGWGENGYGYLKVELNDLYGKYALLTPVTSLITPYETACHDKDGDGYYNWGISEDKPYLCPEGCPLEKDCDDSKSYLGPFDSNGYCVVLDITLIEPNGGEALPSGAMYPIQWMAPTEAVSFKLKYSMNNGKTWRPIDTGITEMSYDWTVPIPPKNKKKCLVKVIGYNASTAKVGADKSDAPFTIEVVKLTSPNGGETLTSETPYTIEWKTYGTKKPVAKAILKYTLNGGKKWKRIDTLTDNTGSYDWTPDVPKTKSKCRVKVVLKDVKGKTVGSDMSDGYFSIEPSL